MQIAAVNSTAVAGEAAKDKPSLFATVNLRPVGIASLLGNVSAIILAGSSRSSCDHCLQNALDTSSPSKPSLGAVMAKPCTPPLSR